MAKARAPVSYEYAIGRGFTDLLKNNPGEAVRNRTLQISAVFPFVESKDEATE